MHSVDAILVTVYGYPFTRLHAVRSHVATVNVRRICQISCRALKHEFCGRLRETLALVLSEFEMSFAKSFELVEQSMMTQKLLFLTLSHSEFNCVLHFSHLNLNLVKIEELFHIHRRSGHFSYSVHELL